MWFRWWFFKNLIQLIPCCFFVIFYRLNYGQLATCNSCSSCDGGGDSSSFSASKASRTSLRMYQHLIENIYYTEKFNHLLKFFRVRLVRDVDVCNRSPTQFRIIFIIISNCHFQIILKYLITCFQKDPLLTDTRRYQYHFAT